LYYSTLNYNIVFMSSMYNICTSLNLDINVQCYTENLRCMFLGHFVEMEMQKIGRNV